jgi:hypothetical protein
MEDVEQQPPQVAGACQASTHQSLVKLPGFWTEDPVSGFRLAEEQFALRNVKDPVARYYHVLASLSQDAVNLVRHVLHEDTCPHSYDNLRTSLLASHSLSNYQKMEKMMKLPPLGYRKPSVMLAEMLGLDPSKIVLCFLKSVKTTPRHPKRLPDHEYTRESRLISDEYTWYL